MGFLSNHVQRTISAKLLMEDIYQVRRTDV